MNSSYSNEEEAASFVSADLARIRLAPKTTEEGSGHPKKHSEIKCVKELFKEEKQK